MDEQNSTEREQPMEVTETGQGAAQATPAPRPQKDSDRQAAPRPRREGRRPADGRRERSGERRGKRPANGRAKSGARRPASGSRPREGRGSQGARPRPQVAASARTSRNTLGLVGTILRIAVPVALIVFVILQVNSCNRIRTLEDEATKTAAELKTAQGALDTLNSEAGLGVKDPWRASGYFTTGNAELDAAIKEFCDAGTDESLSYSENAYNVFYGIAVSDYVERDNNQNPEGVNWAQVYAKQYLDEGSGNCYNFAALMAYTMQYFGYDAVAEPCLVEKQSGSWGDHALIFVKVDGQDYMCDCSLAANGWMMSPDTYNWKINDIGQHGNSDESSEETSTDSGSSESSGSSGSSSTSSSGTTNGAATA